MSERKLVKYIKSWKKMQYIITKIKIKLLQAVLMQLNSHTSSAFIGKTNMIYWIVIWNVSMDRNDADWCWWCDRKCDLELRRFERNCVQWCPIDIFLIQVTSNVVTFFSRASFILLIMGICKRQNIIIESFLVVLVFTFCWFLYFQNWNI